MNAGYMNACPRDGVMVVGDEIIESAMAWRSRLFELYAYKKLFAHYFRQGARWTAAPRPAMGDDLYVKVNFSTFFIFSQSVVGFVRHHSSTLWLGGVVIECWTCNQQVAGSNPSRHAVECNPGASC